MGIILSKYILIKLKFQNLNNIGRDLKKTIIVDNNYLNFKYNTDNAIFVKTWISDKDD